MSISLGSQRPAERLEPGGYLEQDSIVPYHQSRLPYDKWVASGDAARLISFPKAGHGTALAMLSDDAIRAGAHERTTGGGRSTPPSPVTPRWQTVISFLEQSMAKKSR
ncbi:hypothetical protein [Streptomyces sp. NPDC005859]|uniref:hypothetical protein n=1 Tax=Streptomyces sp. NPDC005859 TaxID=3157170 RepID=UPI0033DE9D4A